MSQPIRRKHRITALLLSPPFLPPVSPTPQLSNHEVSVKGCNRQTLGGTRSSSVPSDKPKHPGGFLSWTKAAVTHRLRSTTVRLVDAVVLKLSGNAGHVKMFADTGDGSFPPVLQRNSDTCAKVCLFCALCSRGAFSLPSAAASLK